jgi:hypothetical protein
VTFPLAIGSVVAPPAPQLDASGAMRKASACDGNTRARDPTVSTSPPTSKSSSLTVPVPIDLPWASSHWTRPRTWAGPLGCVSSLHDDAGIVMWRSATPREIGSDEHDSRVDAVRSCPVT